MTGNTEKKQRVFFDMHCIINKSMFVLGTHTIPLDELEDFTPDCIYTYILLYPEKFFNTSNTTYELVDGPCSTILKCIQYRVGSYIMGKYIIDNIRII